MSHEHHHHHTAPTQSLNGIFIFSIVLNVLFVLIEAGVGEVFHQEKRVLKGRFPENPKRHDYYERRRKELGDILKEGPSHKHLKEKMGK